MNANKRTEPLDSLFKAGLEFQETLEKKELAILLYRGISSTSLG